MNPSTTRLEPDPSGVYLMRHGQSEANQSDRIVSDPQEGCARCGLTDQGRRQARRAAQESGLPPDTVIVSSDFLRTLQTAEIVAATLGAAAPWSHPGLRERAFGQLEGLPSARYGEVWSRDDQSCEHTYLEVESPTALAERMLQTLSELRAQHPGKPLLVVSHGDPLRFLQLAHQGRDLRQHNHVRHFVPAEIRALSHLPAAT